MEQWWNDADRGKLNGSKKNPFQCHFFHHTYNMDRGVNLGLCGEKPATNRLSYGTV
jgi:hypothetical protein